jgi:hypothetical protein
VKAFASLDERGEHAQSLPARGFLQSRENFGGRLADGGLVGFGIADLAELGVKKPDELENFGDGGDGALASAARDPLFNGDRGRNAGDRIDVWPFELLDKLPRVGIEAVEIAPLALGKKEIEGERRFARAAQARDDRHFVQGDIDRDIFQVVMARAANLDGLGHGIEAT